MRVDKVREQDSAELQNQLRESQDQLFRLRFQFGMGQMDGLKKYRELKHDRARMLGVLRERELDPAKAAEAEKNAAAAKKRGKKGK
jgi:large subunit ribosomal protein L29